MAETIELNPGTGGSLIATDDAGADGQVQLIKLAVSADGSAAVIPADSDGLLVNLGTNNDVTVAGVATAANQSTGNTSLATIAGAVTGTEMQVDVLTMPTTTVQATNLDVRDLVAASDAVTAHGDVGVLDQIDLTNTNPLAVAIVDGSGDQITSF